MIWHIDFKTICVTASLRRILICPVDGSLMSLSKDKSSVRSSTEQGRRRRTEHGYFNLPTVLQYKHSVTRASELTFQRTMNSDAAFLRKSMNIE